MKPKHILFGALALITASCSNDKMSEVADMRQNGIQVTAGLTANTRVNFEQDGSVTHALWEEGDQITLYAPSQGYLTYQVSTLSEDATSATFMPINDALQRTDETIYAAYRAGMEADIVDGMATLPNTDMWTDEHPLPFAYAIGKVADGKLNLSFEHIFAYLKLTLNAETVAGSNVKEVTNVYLTNPSGTPVSIAAGRFDFSTQSIIEDKGINEINYSLSELFTATGTAEKSIYIPILPQPAGETIKLAVLHIHEAGCDTLFTVSKEVPSTGFMAGRAYTYSPKSSITKAGNTITLTEAGTLSQAISAAEKDTITSLKLIGPLNGDDIRFIREMAGRDVNGNETSGKLTYLDISEASIVTGGDYYYLGEGQYQYWAYDNNLGQYMFSSTILNRILLPESITSISDCAFNACASLTDITIPDGVTRIGGHTFRDCTKLSDVKIGNNVTEIEYAAFLGCHSLANINIPNSVTSIADFAFSECTSLKNITIPNNVTMIGMSAFQMSALTSIDLPDNITSIAEQTFYGCSSLTTIEIPEGVTSIGRIAFNGCQSLEKVTSLAVTPPTLGDGVFSGIASSATLNVPSGTYAAYMASDWAQYFSTIKGEGDTGIYTLEDLIAFRDAVNNGADFSQWVNESNIINLYADIDATTIDWTPINALSNPYCFDGNGHTISLKKTIVRYEEFEKWGLFLSNNDGSIQNLNLNLDMPMTTSVSGHYRNGVLYGPICVYNGGEVKNCQVTIENYTDNYGISLGGLVYHNVDIGVISQCSIKGKVIGLSDIGGIAYCNEGYINDCKSYLSIVFENSGGDALGGIAVYNIGAGKIDYCTNYGDITVTIAMGYGIGGIVGRLFSGIVDNCQNNGNLETPWVEAIGGIAGNASETEAVYPNNTTRIVTNCTNTGNIVGPDGVTGNMIGVLDGADSEMTGCTYGGTVNGATGTEANAIGNDMRVVAPTNPGIYTLEDLIAFRDARNAGADVSQWQNSEGVINIFADIDMSSVQNWEPITHIVSNETLNGNEHTISGLNISLENSSEYEYVGLVGYNHGKIENLRLESGTIVVSGETTIRSVGAICGHNYAEIHNCIAEVSIETKNTWMNTGGIAGQNHGYIVDCENLGNITGIGWTAGISGQLNTWNEQMGGIVERCINRGVISSSDFAVGIGIAGNPDIKIIDCINYGKITSPSSVSGIGYAQIITKCTNEGEVIGGNGDTGGITSALNNNQSLTDCVNKGAVSGNGYTGGIVGAICEDFVGTYSNNTNIGTVNGATGTESNAIGGDLRDDGPPLPEEPEW